jgi:O-antigen/teichoic acid export membrane protein
VAEVRLRSEKSHIERNLAKGAAWMVALRLTVRGLGLVGTIILARLLMPGDFGLIAIATSFVALLEVFSEFSFDMALIRNQKTDRRHYDTAWTLSALRGMATGGLLFIVAVPVANWFAEPRLAEVLWVLGILSALSGLENIGIVEFRKEFRFEKEFMLVIATRLVAFVTTVPLAFWLRNYWALLAGIVASRVLRFVLSYMMHPYRPRPSLKMWQELIGFSKWMLLTSILNFISTRVDTFVIGKVVGVKETGFYQVAHEISTLPVTELVAPISRATYPAYSKLADDLPALTSSFLRSMGIILSLSLPAAMGIALTADLIVGVFLGQKWADTIVLIQILALYAAIRVCFANIYTVFLALNRPDTGTWISVPALVVLVPLLLWWTPQYGAPGAAWALVVAGTITLIFNVSFLMRLLQISIAQFLSCMWRPILACTVMVLGVLLFRVELSNWLANVPQFGKLFIVSGFGAFSYILTMIALWCAAGRPDGLETTIFSVAAARLRTVN